jgi:hypothetical protein
MRRLDFSRFGFYSVLSILTLSFATVSAGCGGDNSGDDDDGGTGGTGGMGAMGGSGGASADAITWTADGWVDATANAYMIQGPWYSYNDCMNAEPAGLPCTVPEASMTGPDTKKGWTADATQVCTKGVAPKVINGSDGMPAYSLQWGAGIALDLNSTGGEMAVKNDFNATAAGVKGFMFDIITNTTPPQPADVRVNIKTKATGDNSHFVTAMLPAANFQVLFSEALQGSWVMPPTTLTQDAIESIQFQVYTNATLEKPYDFCVSNMRAIK